MSDFLYIAYSSSGLHTEIRAHSSVIGNCLTLNYKHMERYDRYRHQLFPGDLIVWSQKHSIYSGKVHSITPAGFLKVYKRTEYGYEQIPVLVKTAEKVVKVLKFP